MAIIKVIFMVAISVALAITLTMKHLSRVDIDKSTTNIASATPPKDLYEDINIEMPFKRVSRFLAEEKNPRAADHCRKDNDICLLGGTNSTCCNNKCMDLSTDEKNCGACKKKCLYTETCCRGDCVDIAYDKRHCGECNHACMPGGYCIYGLCDYA